ncbi:DUF3906 family protein [Priestia megaterium]|nr:DUF3906 family protein [Priestia megaterium]
MNLYRFEATIHGEVIPVVAVAKNDEHAFQLVEIELEKHFLMLPEIDEICLYEKRKIRDGAGIVLKE